MVLNEVGVESAGPDLVAALFRDLLLLDGVTAVGTAGEEVGGTRRKASFVVRTEDGAIEMGLVGDEELDRLAMP
jgi:hypothetical protein